MSGLLLCSFISLFVQSFLINDIKSSPTDSPLTVDQVFNPFPKNSRGKTVANAQTKNQLPVACKYGAQQSLMSFIKTPTPDVNHPSGKQLFPDDATLSDLFSTFLTNLSKNESSKNFTFYFTKIHMLVLHELYIYLTKIYAVFNMTHIDSLLANQEGAKNQKDGYLKEGIQQGLNQKTLIINHLVNIVEAQLNGAIRARFPSLPPLVATYAGTMLMKHDYGVDLNIMMEKAELVLLSDPEVQALLKPDIDSIRNSYLDLLSDYLKFFNRYTQTLQEDDVSKGYVGTNKFAMHAKNIATYMQSFSYDQAASLPTLVSKNGKMEASQEKINALRSLSKLNPPIFFYDEQTMRGLKIIPALAKSLPKNVQKVPWPWQIVLDANEKTRYKPLYGPQTDMLIAFYNSDKSRLFVNIPTKDYIYEQELLPQPDWLNSPEGITKMLQACLGYFSALLDPIFSQEEILDPCIQCIIGKASLRAGLTAASQDKSCKASDAFIAAIQNQIQKNQQTVTPPPPDIEPPSDDGGIS